MVTILMIVHDEIEYVKLSVKSFRLFCDIDVSFVLVDNNSTDGLREWAEEQTDLTYVLLDEGYTECGKAINMVRKTIGIDTDLLTMEGHYMLTPCYLSRLKELLYSQEDIGAVSGTICNDTINKSDVCVDYNAAIAMVNAEESASGKYALMPYNSAVLWKKSALDALGEFEENMDGMDAVTNDYCIRMIMGNRKVMICSNAFLWQLTDKRMEKRFLQDEDRRKLERKWGMHYFNGDYNEYLIQKLEAKAEDTFSVLEIGCDCGATLLEIKNRYPNAEVYGCEINQAAAAVASHVAEVSVNNIEDKNLPFPKRKFDYIIFGDVLEHLHNPLETLIYCKEFLCESGKVISSIPNVMHISVMEQLMKGNFTYMETGLLDKSHIHFFTYNEIIRIFIEAGYKICAISGISMGISSRQQQLIDGLLALEGNVERWMYETFQYNVKAEICKKI